MLFIHISDSTKPSLHEIRQVAEHMLEHASIKHNLSDKQRQELEYILKPTLAKDQHETKVRAMFADILANFTLINHKGEKFRFYQDNVLNTIFFGDEAGWQEAKNFLQNPTKIKI